MEEDETGLSDALQQMYHNCFSGIAIVQFSVTSTINITNMPHLCWAFGISMLDINTTKFSICKLWQLARLSNSSQLVYVVYDVYSIQFYVCSLSVYTISQLKIKKAVLQAA